jgi:hypothetical protein
LVKEELAREGAKDAKANLYFYFAGFAPSRETPWSEASPRWDTFSHLATTWSTLQTRLRPDWVGGRIVTLEIKRQFSHAGNGLGEARMQSRPTEDRMNRILSKWMVAPPQAYATGPQDLTSLAQAASMDKAGRNDGI